MNQQTYSLLLSADDAIHCEFPPWFDGKAERQRVCELATELESIAKQQLVLDSNIQDATFFAELFVAKVSDNGTRADVVFSITFSCFGNFVTIQNNAYFPDERVRQMQSLLNSSGYFVVESTELLCKYTGVNVAFSERTWFDRYFNYI